MIYYILYYVIFVFLVFFFLLDFTSVGSFGQDEVKYSSPSMYTLNPPPPPNMRPPPLLQSEQLNKSLPANLHNYYAAIDIIKVRSRVEVLPVKGGK